MRQLYNFYFFSGLILQHLQKFHVQETGIKNVVCEKNS